jgi:type IV pilus assembly protein PilC
MKHKTLSFPQLSAFCLEVSLFLRAGISINDGLHMLKQDDNNINSRKLLDELLNKTEKGYPFSEALKEVGGFPENMVEKVMLAEKTGKLESTMRSLSDYYARQHRLSVSIKNAVFYPIILLSIMLVVIAVIVTQVLPIFNNVFNQMGAQMSPFAVSLMEFGQALSSVSFVLFVLIGIIIILLILSFVVPKLRMTFIRFFQRIFGDKGVFRRISSARFAFAMAVSLESGIDTDASLIMAGTVAGSGEKLMSRVLQCKQLLAQGIKLGEALTASEVFTSKNSRLISLAERTGTLPEVMHTIAERTEESVRDEIDSIVSKVEPTLVILTSIIVGVILLSVMLPLVSIMSTIG